MSYLNVFRNPFERELAGMMGIGIGNPRRGTLQPAKETLDTVRCERCGCRWVPDAECFGCPGCEQREDLYQYLIKGIDDPA